MDELLNSLSISPAVFWFGFGLLVGFVLFRRKGSQSSNLSEFQGSHSQAAPGSARPQERSLNAEELRVMTDMVRAGNKIEAIKYVREITGFGLKEAKDLVDSV